MKISKVLALFFFIVSHMVFITSCETDPIVTLNKFPAGKVFSLFIDDAGILWAGTDIGVISYWDENWIEYENLNLGEVFDISTQTSLSTSYLWLAGFSGAMRAESNLNSFTSQILYTEESSGLLDNKQYAVLTDSIDATWFATPKGLSIFKENKWYSRTDFGDLEIYPVISMAEGSDGWIFAGTSGMGVGRYKYDLSIDGVSGASKYDTDWTGLPSDTILSVYVDKDNHQWFGTPDGAAYHKAWETKQEWQVFTSSDGLINNRVQAVTGDDEGNIWFGTSEGVSCFHGQAWENYTIFDGLVNQSVNDITIDSKGHIWFATDGGISVFNGSGWQSFSRE